MSRYHEESKQSIDPTRNLFPIEVDLSQVGIATVRQFSYWCHSCLISLWIGIPKGLLTDSEIGNYTVFIFLTKKVPLPNILHGHKEGLS